MQTKELTLMFYFASDNPLASTIVSQLKALKDAGYHPDANVIAQFDPHAVGTPVHIFDVNSVNKFWNPGKDKVGLDDLSPFVRDLVLDRLWAEKDRKIRDLVKGRVEAAMGKEEKEKRNGEKFEPPKPYPRMSGEQNPKDSLTSFLSFCRESYPARHYLLFILGHGQVVGNDTLLYDAHANQHFLTLTELGHVLRGFSTDVQNDREPGKVEMIVLHSCSMSALEVAYELKGAANYMLASQGPMYVGNLPYKRILMRLFDALNKKPSPEDTNEIDEAQNGHSSANKPAEAAAAFLPRLTTESAAALERELRALPHSNKLVAAIVEHVTNIQNGNQEDLAEGGIDIKEKVREIFFDCLYNSYDFQLAGYPFDLCLTDLTRVPETKGLIDALVDSLINGLDDIKNPTSWKQIRQLILLAHLDAQSFYQEDYVDLYDFCFRLRIRCEERADHVGDKIVNTIYEACKGMMDVLEKGDEKFVVRSSFAGAAFQYSHGHSIYFPWKQPEDGRIWDEQYPEYRLTRETKWRDFLSVYFEKTERETRAKEMKNEPNSKRGKGPAHEEDFRTEVLALMGRIGTEALDAEGRLQKVGPDHPMGKFGPDDPSGASCNCPSIKNYPAYTGEKIIKGEVVRIHTAEDFLDGAPVPEGT